MYKDITVLILAGGIGRRFWPFTGAKSGFSFAGESLLFTNLKKLAHAGFHRFVVVVGPADADTLRSFHLPGAEIDVVIQKNPLGMGDAVLLASGAIGTGSCLIVNAHDVVDEALYHTLARESAADAAFVVGKKVSSYFDGGYLRSQKDRLIDIVEKPGVGNEPGNLINLVFHFFPQFDAFASCVGSAKNKSDDAYEQGLAAFAKTHEVRVLSYEGMWLPLKYPWHVLDILSLRLAEIKNMRGRNIHIGKNVIIEGSVAIEDGVRIFENTKIVGPCFIGRGTIIGNNNIIRESNIGAGCVTGFNTDIRRSWIGESCWFHNNYIGDSVVGKNVSMGGGTKLANLRLDEGEIYSVVNGTRMATGKTKFGAIVGADVRMGINASIMPGVKIGRGSFVGAGVVLSVDLPDESWCMIEQKLTIQKNRAKAPIETRDGFKKKL